MLNQQRVFTSNLIAPGYVCYFYQEGCAATVYRRDPTVDDAFAGMHLGWSEAQFVGVVIAGFDRAAQDIAQLGLIVNQLQKRFSART